MDTPKEALTAELEEQVRKYAGDLADAQDAWHDMLHKLQAAQQRIAELEAQVRGLEADAGRYRWLRDIGDATWAPMSAHPGCTASLIDASIDAAIAAQAKKEKP